MKKPYKKPEITKVPLKADEAVLVKCKNRGQGPQCIGCDIKQSVTS